MGFARLLPFALVVALALAALAPTVASARLTRPYQSSFGFLPGDQLQSLAVDQSNGDVYAGDGIGSGASSLLRFDSSGAPKDFTAGPDAGTNALTGLDGDGGAAIDSSGGPLDGDIYTRINVVVDGVVRDEVKVFASDGESVGVLTGAATNEGRFNDICGMTVDQSNGDLYIGQTQGQGGGRILRYRPNSPSGTLEDSDYAVSGIGTAEEQPCALAISSGSVYAASSTGVLHKHPLSAFSAQPPLLPAAESILEGVTALATDPTTEEIYADRGNGVTVLDPVGDLPLYHFGANAYFARSKAIAVESAAPGPAAKVYVTDHTGKQVDVFGAQENALAFSRPQLTTFGPDGTASTSFKSLGQLAFDQATRKLYGLDDGAPGVYGFDASGPPSYLPLAGFNPLETAATGSNPGGGLLPELAVDNSAGGSAGRVYFASVATGLLYGFGPAGAALDGFPIDPAISPGAPYGSPKTLCGAAVDSAGNIWVANSATQRILEYSSAGASLGGAIDTSAQGQPCGLAFDSEDNLYVRTENQVWRYTAASSYSSATLVDSDFGGEVARGIAVDPTTNDVYIAHPNWVDEYDPAGNLIEEFATDIPHISGIALDATNGDVYLSDGAKIHVLAPPVLLPDLTISAATEVTNTTAVLHGTIGAQGLALDACHFEYVSEASFHASGFADLASGGSVPCNPAAGSIPVDGELHSVDAALSGLARNTAYRFRLVAANANGQSTTADVGFETNGPPLVETTGSPVRTATSARLEGRVDPVGKAASYYFEYGTEGPCDSNPCTVTEAHAAGSGEEFELVSQRLEGLQPGAIYHYRVLADNGNVDGPVAGGDMTLTTFASEAPLSHGHFPGPPGSDRAWEMASEADSGGNPVGPAGAASISDNGDRVVYSVNGGTPLSESGRLNTELFAERTSSGWQTKNIYAPREEALGDIWQEPGGPTDLSAMVAENRFTSGTGESSVWRLTPDGAPERIYSGPFAARNGGGFFFFAVSEDASRTLISLTGTIDPEHPLPPNVPGLYDLSSSPPKMVSLLPDGSTPACGIRGSQPEAKNDRSAHWVSANGSLAFFESTGATCDASDAPQRLYVRDIPAETTRLISSPPISGAECPSYFIKSIPGSAYFYTESRLVPEDDEPTECGNQRNGDIYRYDLGSEALECVTCKVADIDAMVVFTGNSSDISTHVGISEDGSRIYFNSAHRLLLGAVRNRGTYRLDTSSGDLAYVGSFGSIGDYGNSTMTPDGSVVVFSSDAESLNAINGQQNDGTQQYYRYDDHDRSLICVSCPADGSAPRGGVSGVRRVSSGTNLSPISADGGDFAFATPTPLVAADQNTVRDGRNPNAGMDVYEWREGRLLLVSDGLSNWPASQEPSVSGMTPSGHDIFFTEAAELTSDALDGYRRLYDARIGGGFEFPPPKKPCPLEVCQGTPKGAPEEQAPGTQYLQGAEGAAVKTSGRCPKAKLRHRGHCVGRHKKRTNKPTHHKRAKHNRRGA